MGLNLDCDYKQGFEFRKDQEVQVGFLLTLSVGGKSMGTGFKVTDPTSSDSKFEAVAVLRKCSWAMGKTEPLQFVGQVSAKTKKEIDLLLEKDMVSVEVKFKYCIYTYDTDKSALKYYKSFHSNDKELTGKITKSGKSLQLYVNTDKDTGVAKPENYKFGIVIDPGDEKQDLHRAVSCSDKFVREWGVDEG